MFLSSKACKSDANFIIKTVRLIDIIYLAILSFFLARVEEFGDKTI